MALQRERTKRKCYALAKSMADEKMSSMQAALGLAQLERIEELVIRKRQIFNWYQAELGNISGITLIVIDG